MELNDTGDEAEFEVGKYYMISGRDYGCGYPADADSITTMYVKCLSVDDEELDKCRFKFIHGNNSPEC